MNKADKSMSRIEASKRVMRALAVRETRPRMVTLDDGSAPLIVCLPSDYVSEVLARVSRIGGKANVVISYAKHFDLITVDPGRMADADLIINRDLSMGMLSLRIKENPGKTVRVHFRGTNVVPDLETEFEYATA